MLTKILLTALVIGAAYLFLRYKRGTVREATPLSADPGSRPVRSQAVRRLAGVLLIVFLTGTGGFFVHRWYDDQTLMAVRVINSVTGEAVLYQAYKGDLEGRSFVTIYNQAVSIADNERMEIGEAR